MRFSTVSSYKASPLVGAKKFDDAVKGFLDIQMKLFLPFVEHQVDIPAQILQCIRDKVALGCEFVIRIARLASKLVTAHLVAIII